MRVGLGNNSNLGVDEASGIFEMHTGSVSEGLKENTPLLETEVIEDVDFTFKVRWESSDVDKKSSNKGHSCNKNKGKNKAHI